MPVIVELSRSEDLEPDDGSVPLLPQLEAWANASCLKEGDVVASIKILTADEMKAINREYRGKDKPTNVLSFPMQVPEQFDINLLGDLALCAEVINTEAEQQDKSRDAHWAHMMVHGMLHLQGYDHVDEEDATVMESLEIQIMKKLGFENPYNTISRN